MAILFALGLYARDRRIKENITWLPYLLGIIRFLAVLGILFLLLTPLFKRFVAEKQKPVIVLLKDQSASIQASTEASTLELVEKGLGEFTSNISKDFEIVDIPFGENFGLKANDTIDGQSTNISKVLEYVSETFEDQNLGAIVLASDGIYNEGKNPLYAQMQLSVPLYTVPLGDTTIRTDILIKNVLHNRIVYLNDKFLIEADIQAYNSKGARNNVTLYKVIGDKQTKVETKSFTIDSDNYFKSFKFEVPANSIGNVKYRVSVSKLNNEITTTNNARNIYVEVLDARQKILLLAHATHPDIKAFKKVIKSNKNYELDIVIADETPASITAYDLVILHNLPSGKHKISSVLDQIRKSRTPVFFVTGGNSNLNKFGNLQDVITVRGANGSMNDVTAVKQGDFDLFTLSESMASELNSYVPLKVPFGEYKASATSKVLLKQRIGSVQTEYPLLAYSDIKNHKQAVLAGEGLWKWQLYEYQEFESFKNSTSLIQKTIQYLSQKKDKRQFRAYVSKNAFKENESVNFDAQLYNENYEPINDPDARLVIKNAKGESFDYQYTKSNNAYYVDAGRYPEGNYTFTASTNYNGKDLTAAGKFSIQSLKKETYDLTAKHSLLNDLAKEYGGKLIYPENLAALTDEIRNNDSIKPIIHQKAETTPVLDLWWLLPFLLVLLIVEWFLRRYFGNY